GATIPGRLTPSRRTPAVAHASDNRIVPHVRNTAPCALRHPRHRPGRCQGHGREPGDNDCTRGRPAPSVLQPTAEGYPRRMPTHRDLEEAGRTAGDGAER